jgi:hypothetical protein
MPPRPNGAPSLLIATLLARHAAERAARVQSEAVQARIEANDTIAEARTLRDAIGGRAAVTGSSLGHVEV